VLKHHSLVVSGAKQGQDNRVGDEALFPTRFVKLQERLQLYSPESIYERYEDKAYYAGLSFRERKELMILMNHYVVNIPAKLAFSLVGRDSYERNRIGETVCRRL